jgi:3-deoxy-7-phosphoheptulonate synthase
VAFLKVALRKAGIPCGIIVDCSHANSGKDYRKQTIAFNDIAQQIREGETALKGFMLESYLLPGKQNISHGEPPAPGLSITDGCIGWEETEEILCKAAEASRERMKKLS